jgi:hypothetical protein
MVVEWGIVREGAAERADLVTLRALVAVADMRGRETGERIGDVGVVKRTGGHRYFEILRRVELDVLIV